MLIALLILSVVWLLVVGVVIAVCRMAARGDAQLLAHGPLPIAGRTAAEVSWRSAELDERRRAGALAYARLRGGWPAHRA